MKSHRPARVADQILRDVSDIVFREVKDPKLGFVTFSRVEMSNDLKYAKIFFTILGTQEEQLESRRALNRSRAFIQVKIGKRLGLRNTPEISFVIDKGLENSLRVNELLNRIQNERQQRDNNTNYTDENQSADREI